MTPPRVALDLRLAAYRAGGISRYATELYSALSGLPDLSVHALRSRKDTAPDPEALYLRTPPHHRLERYAIAAELTLARRRFDVYHATDFITPRLPRTAIVATVHDLAFLERPGNLDASSLAYYRQIQQSRQWTDAWITPSQWTASDLSSRFDIDPSSIAVIPHGVSLGLQRQPVVPRSSRGDYILAVGTVEPRKRYDLLLDTFTLMRHHPRLEVVGRSGWKVDVTATRLETTERISWRRDTGDAELRDLYRNALAVVVPSDSEGFGFAALEAMACGTPVISSNRGALPEVTDLAALVPEGDDPHAWAVAIERLLEDEQLWNELSAFGRRRSREFSWNRAARETAAVYRRIARS